MAKGDEGKEQYWSRHFGEWRSSGLSRREYCAREKLAVSSFGYWQRRLREKVKPAEASLTLVPVQVAEPNAEAGWVLRSPGGWSLVLPATVSAGFVADVFKRLP